MLTLTKLHIATTGIQGDFEKSVEFIEKKNHFVASANVIPLVKFGKNFDVYKVSTNQSFEIDLNMTSNDFKFILEIDIMEMSEDLRYDLIEIIGMDIFFKGTLMKPDPISLRYCIRMIGEGKQRVKVYSIYLTGIEKK